MAFVGCRISTAKGGGPDFVGWIHGIYEDSGSCLVDVSSHFRIPFPLKRSPKWLKVMTGAVTETAKNGTGSRFFMDWDDAVAYLQDHYIPKALLFLFVTLILEDSADHYYTPIIAQRDEQRWGDDFGKDVNQNQNKEAVKEMGRWDLPEVREVLDEVSGGPGTIPLSALPKLAEIEILYAVDRIVLGNRWFRKATGIQPKFPYVVDSFERKTASFPRANKPPVEILDSEFENANDKQAQIRGSSQFPFGDWLTHPWLNKQLKQQKSLLDTRRKEDVRLSHLLPKVTIVNISTEELVEESEASIQKAAQLMKGLDQEDQLGGVLWTNSTADERDPLFVAHFDELSSWYSTPRVG